MATKKRKSSEQDPLIIKVSEHFYLAPEGTELRLNDLSFCGVLSILEHENTNDLYVYEVVSRKRCRCPTTCYLDMGIGCQVERIADDPYYIVCNKEFNSADESFKERFHPHLFRVYQMFNGFKVQVQNIRSWGYEDDW